MLEARKSVVWIPATGGVRPISHQEDLFGCFDFLILGVPAWLVQVTTEQKRSQTVTARKRKIEKKFIELYGANTAQHFTLRIWSWVPRSHFIDWKWEPDVDAWVRAEDLVSPLIKRAPRVTA